MKLINILPAMFFIFIAGFVSAITQEEYDLADSGCRSITTNNGDWAECMGEFAYVTPNGIPAGTRDDEVIDQQNNSIFNENGELDISTTGNGVHDATSGGNIEDVFSGNTTREMVLDPVTGESRLETPQEAAERVSQENSSDGTTSYTPDPGSFTNNFNDKQQLEKYCTDREAAYEETELLIYDGGVCPDIDTTGGYSAFIKTANDVIGWIVGIAFMIAAGVGFFAGLKYVASAADPGQRSAAKSMLVNVAIGLFLIFAAWFIVDFILNTFAKSGDAGVGEGSFSGLKK